MEPHSNPVCCFELILEAAPYKTVTVRPLASHLTYYQNKMNMLEK